MAHLSGLRTEICLRRFVTCAFIFSSVLVASAAAQCEDAAWVPGGIERRQGLDLPVSTSIAPTSTPLSGVSGPLVSSQNTTSGQVNCRYTANTASQALNYYTCSALATRYRISIETFFQLNPGVKLDCSNLRADTDYCVRGFIEPLRAWDGRCGPRNGNATCLGTAKQCCNGDTFICGDSAEDCADGTCYEGACAGDTIFTSTGDCGLQHGFKLCAGRWGDCCNKDGRCGTGSAFCAYGECQLGNCTMLPSKSLSSASPTLQTTSSKGSSSSRGTTSSIIRSSSSTSRAPTSNSATTRSSTTSSSARTMTSKIPVSPASSTSRASTTSVASFDSLPACGKTCFNNMLSQYSALSCASGDSYCLCNNINFPNGIRDCSNGACGTAVGSAVISYGSAYCATALATHTPTATGLAALPSCGQTCFKNMLAQYSALGCAQPSASCLCKNADFGNGLRDCSNGACGTAAASSIIAYGSSYCASATAAR